MGRRIRIEDMTPGQLKLEFASLCQWHQCDGVKALGTAHLLPPEDLRRELLVYDKAAKIKDWKTAEDALIRIANGLS